MGVDSAPDGTPMGLTFASQRHFRRMCCQTSLRVFLLREFLSSVSPLAFSPEFRKRRTV